MRCRAPFSGIFSIGWKSAPFPRNSSVCWLTGWLDTNPIVPSGQWFKRFPEMTICGEGELVKTVLSKDQSPFGEEVL